MKINPWWQSHKFWTMVAGVILAVGTVLSGEATVPQVINQVLILILGYMGIRVTDVAMKGGKK